MANYIECPNCKQKVPAGDSFCNYCGVKLPEGPVMSDDPAPSEGVIKRCRNGHEFNDPELDFCPICGFPLETVGGGPVPEVPEDGSWICSCGHVNYPDSLFCMECGTPRDSVGTSPAGPAEDGSWICSCGHKNLPEALFCMECGTPRPVTETPAPVIEEPVYGSETVKKAKAYAEAKADDLKDLGFYEPSADDLAKK